MERISDARLYEFFLQTLSHCGTFLLACDDRDIGYYLFEEFDGESITFLHENSLDPLLAGGYISAEIYPLCQKLRRKFRNLEETSLWNVESVRTAPEWYEIMLLADRIRSMVNGV